MKLNEEIKMAFLCRTEMYVYFFGTEDSRIIESQLANSEFKVLNMRYVNAVFNNIRMFPTSLSNVMDKFPLLDYDVELLSEQYSEGFTSGFIRQIIEYCKNNNIQYSYEDEILFVNNYLIACNNSLFYNLFEIENMLLELNKELKVK
jgi:hypothetical protein